MSKFRYAPLALLSAIAGGGLFLGSILFIFFTDRIVNAISSLGYGGTGGIQFSFYLFLFALAAAAVAAVYQIIYYIRFEKKRAILVGGIASAAAFLCFLFAINDLVLSMVNSISNMFSQTSSGDSGSGLLIFAVLVATISFIINGAIVLQMAGVMRIPFLIPVMPTAQKAEHETISYVEEASADNKKTYACFPLLITDIIFQAVMMFAYLLLQSAISSISSFQIAGGITNLINGMLLTLVACLGIGATAVQFYIYQSKTEKSTVILIHAIANTVCAAFLFIYEFMQGASSLLTIGFIISLLILVLDIIMVLMMKDFISIPALRAYMPKAIITDIVESKETSDTVEHVNAPAIRFADIKKFFRSKAGIAILAAVLLCGIATGGYKIWDTWFNKTEIDLFTSVKITCSGNNGEGYAQVTEPDIEYDKEDFAMSQFVKGVTYSIEHNGELSNGDKVSVKAVYSEERADDLKLDIKRDTKEFSVSGLTVRYKNAKAIDKKVYKKAEKLAINDMKNRDKENRHYTLVHSYYAIAQKTSWGYDDNRLIFVFQNDYKDYDEKDKTGFVYIDMRFDSSFDEKNVTVWPLTLYDSSYDQIEDVKAVEPALKLKFEDYKLELIK